MKKGKSLSELAAEIERQSSVKEDFIVPNGELRMEPDHGELVFQDEQLAVTDHAARQIAAHTGIGTRYYEKMRADSPALLAGNVNHWLQHESNRDNRRMIRELDGNARAFLSDRYLRLDNDVTMQTALTALADVEEVKVESCEVTDSSLFIKALFPKTEGEVKVGDIVQSGVVITNSEIGAGSFQVRPMFYRLWCLNGCTTALDGAGGVKRRHVGSRVTETEIVYSAQTIELAAQHTLSECRDAIRTFTSPEYMQRMVARLTQSTESERVQNPEKGIERLAKAFSFSETERSSILERFIREQDYSQYGALNAVTNLANDVESYDRASQLEEIGGRILDLTESQWHTIAMAA